MICGSSEFMMRLSGEKGGDEFLGGVFGVMFGWFSNKMYLIFFVCFSL